MKTVHKFPLTHVTSVPDGKIVLIAQQDGSILPTAWIEYDPAHVGVQRTIELYGTGHPTPPNRIHIGSAICGHFVWHAYMIDLS